MSCPLSQQHDGMFTCMRANSLLKNDRDIGKSMLDCYTLGRIEANLIASYICHNNDYHGGTTRGQLEYLETLMIARGSTNNFNQLVTEIWREIDAIREACLRQNAARLKNEENVWLRACINEENDGIVRKKEIAERKEDKEEVQQKRRRRRKEKKNVCKRQRKLLPPIKLPDIFSISP